MLKLQNQQGVPFILIENGYTEKKTSEIHHDHLIKDFVGIEAIIGKYKSLILIKF